MLTDVNEEALQKAVQIVLKNIPTAEVMAVRADVSKEAEVAAAVEAAVAKFGRLDVAVSRVVGRDGE